MEPNEKFYSQSKRIHGLELIEEALLLEKAIRKYELIPASEEKLLIYIFERNSKSSFIRNSIFESLKRKVNTFETLQNSRNHQTKLL